MSDDPTGHLPHMGQGSRRIHAVVVAIVVALGAPTTARAAEPPPPPGANVDCTPTAAHPRPVVLVHGTFLNRTNTWRQLSPALKAQGYCVFALNYGASQGSAALNVYGTGPVADSAAQLRSFVDDVLRRTGASQVDIVGHSQGGMMPRYFIRRLGGASQVHQLVSLAASNHGTLNPLLVPAGVVCFACLQQSYESPFIKRLNAGDETPGDVRYTNIVTRYDEVVVPFDSGFLAGATNIVLQRVDPSATAEHLLLPGSPVAVRLVEQALAR